MADVCAGTGGSPAALLEITVALCLAPRTVREWVLQLPPGATVHDALQACGAKALWSQHFGEQPAHIGIWGRATVEQATLAFGDRVELYRPLQVDPKVARRERFARQGSRGAGLFARQRAGAKPGY